jgi:hypothetical protein
MVFSLSDSLPAPKVDAPGRPDFFYSPKSGRYHFVGGGFVSRVQFKAMQTKYVADLQLFLASLSQRLLNGEFRLDQWQEEFGQTVKDLTLQQYILGRGGVNSVTNSNLDHVQKLVDFELDKLMGFAADIKGQRMKTTAVIRRSKMYGAHSKKAYWDGRNAAMLAAGKTHHINRLFPGESCKECVEISERGPIPIGSAKQIGDRLCLFNCNCEWEYVTLEEAQEQMA